MTDYTISDLERWNERIEAVAKECGLDYYAQEFELCNYEDMLCYEAYAGMPARYPHWSFGKAYERQKTFYQYNLVGLPYEMVINANPCIAYLMQDNTLLLQILTIAHVYGHNDFFKNNRLFREGTRAEMAVEMFKTHADRIRRYTQDPRIGQRKVERILDAAHALRFQTSRMIGGKPPARKELNKEAGIPVFEYDLLGFLMEWGRLEDWERDIVGVVWEETRYFLPQIETKIMNEGWASYWHYRILNKLDLPQGLHLEFLQRHNMVIRPYLGRINPYYVGFRIFADLVNRYPEDPGKIFAVRAVERDQSFIRRYLTRELCEELHLFTYMERAGELVVEEIADADGWMKVRDHLVRSIGLSGIPVVKVKEWQSGNALILEHEFDGREVELSYAQETLKYVVDLWGGPVRLITKLNNAYKVLTCNERKEIFLQDA